MARALFKKGEQKNFIERVYNQSGLTFEKLASSYSLCSRTLREWKNEKFNADYETILALSENFNVPLPKIKKIDAYWYTNKGGKIGAKKRFELYGPLGTPAGRVKGGKISQQRRKEDPEKYRLLGCNIKKDFKTPAYSEKLAELTGIIMGDGSINDYQVRITLSKIVDRKYAYFVRKLMEEVLGEKPYWMERKTENTIELILSGVGLVEVLESLGLRRGDKVRNQIDFPKWIKKSLEYRIACIRGLFDTDGGLYIHKKKSGKYLGWCFASHSRPILEEFEATLKKIGLVAKKVENIKLYMYSAENISKYMRIVGSHNHKNIRKVKQYS